MRDTKAALRKALDARPKPANRGHVPAEPKPEGMTPTAEQMRRVMEHDRFVEQDIVDKGKGGRNITIGKAYRRRPMIDILRDTGVLSADQHKALKHYRHHADIADCSPITDSLSLSRSGGGGDGKAVEILNAMRVTRDCENAAGSLAPILRAVVVYDRSLSDWAIATGGSVENCRTRSGKRACKIEAKPAALKRARLDFIQAAIRVQAEIDA